jgi:HK97 family phage major capsid protein
MKKSEEILNSINTIKNEVEVLKDKEGRFVGENLTKAKDKLDAIKALKAEYEVQRNVEDMALEDIKDKVVENRTKNIIEDGKEDAKVKDKNMGVIMAKALVGKASKEELVEVKNLMSEGDNTKGGLTVPQDIQTQIIELQRNQFDMRPYINVEPVGTMKGSRPIETNAPQASGFASVDENGEIQALYEPVLGEIDYAVRKYAGTIPLTSELLDDTAENILAYINRWMAKNELNTYNYQVFNGTGTKSAQGIMNDATLQTDVDFTGTTTAAIKALKSVINKDLEDLASDNVKIFTNGDGYEFIDELEDKNGHPYLQPDPTLASGFRFLGKELVKVPSKFLENVTGEDSVARTPFIVGDLKALYTMYDRKQMTIASTNIGGDSWKHDTTEVKGIFRFDGKLIDKGAGKVLLAKLA